MKSKNGWKVRRVGEVAKVISGYAFKSADFRDDGIPVIKIKNIRVGHVDLSEVDCGFKEIFLERGSVYMREMAERFSKLAAIVADLDKDRRV